MCRNYSLRDSTCNCNIEQLWKVVLNCTRCRSSVHIGHHISSDDAGSWFQLQIEFLADFSQMYVSIKCNLFKQQCVD